MAARPNDRRGFLHGILAAGAVASARPVSAAAQPQPAAGDFAFLPPYARALNYKSLKQSSFDKTGGNSDRWPIAAGGVQEVFNAHRSRRDHPHLVHHCRPRRRPSQGNRPARLLGRQRQAQRRGPGGRFLRPQSRELPDLPVAVPGLLAGASR